MIKRCEACGRKRLWFQRFCKPCERMWESIQESLLVGEMRRLYGPSERS